MGAVQVPLTRGRENRWRIREVGPSVVGAELDAGEGGWHTSARPGDGHAGWLGIGLTGEGTQDAMAKVFNPPPNWPTAPQGWQPPPGWQPDPVWGPVPPGWSLWTRANRHPFAYSAAVAGALYVLLVVGAALLGQANAGNLGYLLGMCLLPWLITGLIARANGSRWQWWLYVLVVVGIFSCYGRRQQAGRPGRGALTPPPGSRCASGRRLSDGDLRQSPSHDIDGVGGGHGVVAPVPRGLPTPPGPARCHPRRRAGSGFVLRWAGNLEIRDQVGALCDGGA